MESNTAEFRKMLASDPTFGECIRDVIDGEVSHAAVIYREEEDADISREAIEQVVMEIDRAVHEVLSEESS